MVKNNKNISNKRDLWIISKGRYAEANALKIDEGAFAGSILEYDISDLTRYLLSPNPIEIEKKLLGCEVRYHHTSLNWLNEKIHRIISKKDEKPNQNVKTFLSMSKSTPCSLQDKDLRAYIEQFTAQLKPFDPVIKGLTSIDIHRVSDIIGICEEDIEGNRSWLHLKGSISEKMDYICRYLGENVKVILEKAHVADSLFELRGFDFASFNTCHSHRLLKLRDDGVTRACVLNRQNRVDFWVDDIGLIQYMHLLDQSLRTNPNFAESFRMCIQRQAKPLRILFNKKMEIDYSKSNLPKAYREVFDSCDIPLHGADLFMNSLRNLQFGISFQYIPYSSTGAERLFTNISVMHDLRALEPIKEYLPKLYSEINKRASVSEAGKFYLLDSIKGYNNE